MDSCKGYSGRFAMGLSDEINLEQFFDSWIIVLVRMFFMVRCPVANLVFWTFVSRQFNENAGSLSSSIISQVGAPDCGF